MNTKDEMQTTGAAVPAAVPAAVAVRPADKIRALIESERFRDQVSKALPRHLTPDRFLRVALTACTRTPRLFECDQTSLFSALLALSQIGLEPDGRAAHLIPFENRKRGCVECQLIIDYKGLVELAMRSGNVAAIHADTVRESDVFEYNRGTIETHKIDFRKPRGEVFAVYALVRFKDGAEKAEVMTREDVEKVRLRSRAGQSGPWMTDWEEMAKKTVFRRLSKWIPLSAEFRAANEHDADALPELISGARLEAPRPLRPAGAPEPEPEPEPAVELTAADCVSFIADAESSRKADLRRALMRSGLKSGDDWREAPAGVLAAIVADLKGGSDAND